MLSLHDESLLRKNACVPEHIYPYVVSISKAEPHYREPFLYYEREDSFVLVGYPLEGEFDEKRFKELIYELKKKKKAAKILAISPRMLEDETPISSDMYYILDVKELRIRVKNRNMLKRAKKEVTVEREKKLTLEHLNLVEEFILWKNLRDEMAMIFRNLSAYVDMCSHAVVLSARNLNGKIVAFDIIDTFSSTYAFYMFNIRSKEDYVPGTSDVLFEEMINIAEKEQKRFINLGLGINEGVRFFKEKWGGRPFLSYYLYEWTPKNNLIDLILRRFL